MKPNSDIGDGTRDGQPRSWVRAHRVALIALVAIVAVAIPLTGYAMANSSTSGTPSAAGATSPNAATPNSPSAAAGTQAPALSGASPISTAGFPSGPSTPGIFTDRCGYSHEAADDPILAPNEPGMAMHHDFYGNVATSASSTAASLRGGETTCSTSADASAYWTPVLYQNGQALTPGAALIYWRRPAGDTESVQSVPTGLQMIAGDESATAPQSLSVISWTCSADTVRQVRTATPHDCSGGELRLTVTFPSCWDGHTLPGASQTNVVYRTGTGCPASHPIQIPQIVFHVNYSTSSAAELTLSMSPTMQGSTDTEHVDFINGWNPAILERNVTACVATSTRCGPVAGSQAVPRGPVTAATTRRR